MPIRFEFYMSLEDLLAKTLSTFPRNVRRRFHDEITEYQPAVGYVLRLESRPCRLHRVSSPNHRELEKWRD